MGDNDLCECGHVHDEHERGGPCTVTDCGCVHFDLLQNDLPDFVKHDLEKRY